MYLSRRQVLTLVVLLTVTLLGGGILAWRRATRGTVTVSEAGPAEPAAGTQVVVHVCGAVRAPNVYTLRVGARIYEAIDRAGGAMPDADLESLNLAAALRDGEQIHVPRKGEAPAPAPAGASSGTPRMSPPAAKTKLPLHLNQASATELEALPGIGPALAGRIVAYRQANGAFARADDLLNVSGIGQKTLERIRPYVLVP